MDQFKGKKMLILGATASEISLIKRAQQFGIYVIVTDNNYDRLKSPAKNYANEAWDISWSDIDELEKKCIQENIDGIVAGYSEFRVENLIKLCDKLNKPCYITMEQLDITRDKVKFKKVCRENNVPVVKEYNSIDEVSNYPVIVKPTDRAGSIGISIARNNEELLVAYNYAMEKSVSKNVIIEDFIANGTKFDVYYAVMNGAIKRLTTCDTINAKNNAFSKVVQSAWLYPSKYERQMEKNVEESLINMIKSMNIKNGCIFFSGFVLPNNEFVFFECGFRMEGAHQYNYTFEKGPFNFLDLFIIHALTGETDLLSSKDINENLKCVIINLYANKGKIEEIIGFDKIRDMEFCTLSLIQSYIGQECSDENAILSKLGMFAFANESLEVLKKQVDRAYELVDIKTNNNSMIYDKINTELILEWWNNK